MGRKQTSIQVTEATRQQVEFLKRQGFGTFTDICRIAIDRMYQGERKQSDRIKGATNDE